MLQGFIKHQENGDNLQGCTKRGSEHLELYCVPHIDLDHIDLVLLSDLHAGCQNWAEDLLKRDIDAIKNNPFARVLIPGDLFQRDLKNHKVGDVYGQAIPPSKQKYYMRDLLLPIKDKIIGMCEGNHDARGSEDASEVFDLCELLGVHYFTDEICCQFSVGAMDINKKPAVFSMYGLHGFAGGKIGNVANRLMDLSNVADADIYFVGHSHQSLYFPVGWFRRDLYNHKMTPITRHYIACGSYQGREKYPVTKAMIPKVLGSVTVRLSGRDKKIAVSLPNVFTV